MKKFPLIVAATILFGCGTQSPSELANEVCECYKEVYATTNQTKKLKLVDQCFSLMQRNLEDLERLGVDNDWSTAQVEKARSEFDRAYSKCSGDTKQNDNSVGDDSTEENNTKEENTITENYQESENSTANHLNQQYDNAIVEREIKIIKQKFYSINYKILKVDTLLTSQYFEADETLIFKDKNNDVVKIKEIYNHASLTEATEYYYTNQKLYFIYSTISGTNTSDPKSTRTYVYQNDVIKILEDGQEIMCEEDCDFSLQSKPYRLLRFYLGKNY